MRQTAWRTRLDRIAETLIAAITPGEKLIEATPERITLILKETPVEQVLGLAREAVGNWGQGLESRTMSFPTHSRNFYNYIDPGF
jgi:hypothetical protein